MICDLPKWWAFLTYDSFKYHVNVAEGLDFSKERIKVRKEEAGTINLNQAYDKLQEKKEKAQTRQLLDMARRKVCGQITQWNIIMIISTSIQNMFAKLWTDYFVAVNLHPRHGLSFSELIKKIDPAVTMGETDYFWNHEGSC